MRAFVESASMCEKSCSRDELCGYYKYFNEDDARQPMMCYHLKSCSPRVIRSQVGGGRMYQRRLIYHRYFI